MKAERVFCRLRDVLHEKRTTLEQVWNRCAGTGGQLSAREFHTFLRRVGFSVSGKEFKRLLSYPELRPLHVQGGIDFSTISTNLLNSTFREGDRVVLEGSSNRKHAGMSTLKFVDAAEANKQFQELLKMNFRTVKNAFMQADSNRDGRISLFEFRTLFTILGITIKDAEFDKITPLYMKHFNRSGELDFEVVKNKFADKVVTGPRGSAVAAVAPQLRVLAGAEEAIAALSEHVTRKHKSTTRAFRQVDANHDGQISELEFRRFLEIINIRMSDTEFEKLLYLLHIRTQLRRDGLDVATFQRTLVRAAEFGLPSLSPSSLLMPGLQNTPSGGGADAASPTRYQSPKARVSAATALATLRVWLARKYGSLQKMFMVVDVDQDGLITEDELGSLLERAHLQLAAGQFRVFVEKARRFEAPGGGWRFQNFCNLVLGREPRRQQQQEVPPNDSREGRGFLPDIHARSPKTQHRLQKTGKQLLQGRPLSEVVATSGGSATQRSYATEDAVRRLRQRQARSERKMVAQQLKLKQGVVARAGVGSELLQRVCLAVYPVWKQLRGTLQKLAQRRQGLCDARAFCQVLTKSADLTAEDATTMAHSFYEDRGSVDGVNYIRFLEAVVRNFARR